MPEYSSPCSWLFKCAKNSPLAVSLQWGDRQLSYSRLKLDAQQIANSLIHAGVGERGVVAIISDDSYLIAKAAYAALFMDAVLFPIDPKMAIERKKRLLRDAGCSLLLTDEDWSKEDLRTWPLSSLADVSLSPEEANHSTADSMQPIEYAKDDPLLIIATSGSTGEPKGVMLSGNNLAASVDASRQRFGLKPGDCWLNCLPLFHIGGLSILYRCLEAGASVLLHRHFDGVSVWSDILRQRATHISLVPAMLSRLLDVAGGAAPPESLKVVLIGGGGLSAELAARAHQDGWPLCVSFGMSETASQLATDCTANAGLDSGWVGKPLEGFEISLSHEGRVRVRGEAVMAGYVNPGLEPGDGLKDGWFETGDLGEIGPDGSLRILGRAGDRLVSGGKTIHPAEVEILLNGCAGVDEAAVTGVPDPIWGDRLVALYAGTIDEEALSAWAKSNLPSALRPRHYMRVKALPRIGMGKIDRVTLHRVSVAEFSGNS